MCVVIFVKEYLYTSSFGFFYIQSNSSNVNLLSLSLIQCGVKNMRYSKYYLANSKVNN